MVQMIKLLSMVSLFKDVTVEVQKLGAEKRKWYMQRSVWGAILAVASALLATFLGVTLDQSTIDSLLNNIPQLVTVGTTLWGIVLSLYGLIMKAKKAA